MSLSQNRCALLRDMHVALTARNPPSSCPVHIGTLWSATDLLAKGFACRVDPKKLKSIFGNDAEI
jgi:hypothetical protein